MRGLQCEGPEVLPSVIDRAEDRAGFVLAQKQQPAIGESRARGHGGGERRRLSFFPSLAGAEPCVDRRERSV